MTEGPRLCVFGLGIPQPLQHSIISMPVSLDPAFNLQRNAILRRLVEKWGSPTVRRQRN